MAPRPKVEVAREHLSKAQEEAAAGDLKDAVQWSFASLEAAIDALAASGRGA
jgi:HEPN domain-containing protein